jgi:hypothetical protein
LRRPSSAGVSTVSDPAVDAAANDEVVDDGELEPFLSVVGLAVAVMAAGLSAEDGALLGTHARALFLPARHAAFAWPADLDSAAAARLLNRPLARPTLFAAAASWMLTDDLPLIT